MMPYSLDGLVQLLVFEQGEAVHLHPNESPVLEVQRVLYRVEGPALAPQDTETLLRTAASEDDLIEFRSARMVCFYHDLGEEAVFQVMAF